jgi:hypothetical protein
MTGTLGYVIYKVDDGLTAKLYFDNPYLGGNGYSASVIGQSSDDYDASYPGSSGHKSRFICTLRPKDS